MGAGQSGMEIGGSSMGYQVLRVYPDSPGSKAGLKAYFDFIIAIGNTRFNKENGSLREILKASVDQKLKMIVLNTRTKTTREVEIVPSFNWGGNGLLGVSIKHSSFDRADDRVWHVVEVEPGSPAYQAGFKAGKDYIIGSDSILQENDDLYNLVETHEGKALKLFVYNIETDNCREVICHPNSKWGGKGYLGCEFGHGLLHRIPFNNSAGDGPINESSRAPLLKNEQSAAKIQQNVSPPSTNNNNSYTFQTQLMQQQLQTLQNPMQPGHQLLQKALLDLPPPQQMPQALSLNSAQQSQSLMQMQQQLQQQMQQQQQLQHQLQQGQQQQQEQQQQQPTQILPQQSNLLHQQLSQLQLQPQQQHVPLIQQQPQQQSQPNLNNQQVPQIQTQQQQQTQPQQQPQTQVQQQPSPEQSQQHMGQQQQPILQNQLNSTQQEDQSELAASEQPPQHQVQQQPQAQQQTALQQQPALQQHPVYPPPYPQPMYSPTEYQLPQQHQQPQPQLQQPVNLPSYTQQSNQSTEYQQQLSGTAYQPRALQNLQKTQQEPQHPPEEIVLPPPPQFPQTFAQLASYHDANPFRGQQ